MGADKRLYAASRIRVEAVPYCVSGREMTPEQANELGVRILGWANLDAKEDPEFWMDLRLKRLLSGDGMLEIIAAMQERGYRAHLCSPWEKRGTWLADFFKGIGLIAESNEHYGNTLPEAVMVAAHQTLSSGGSSDG